MTIETRTISHFKDEKANQKDFLSYLLKNKNKFNVTRTSYIDGFSEIDIPVAIAYRPNSKVLSQSGGKGLSRNQAMISAIMESFECNAAEKVHPCIEKKSIDEINSLNIKFVDPHDLPTTLTQFEKHCPIDWSYCNNLFTKEKKLVPFDAITLDFTRMSNLNKIQTMQLTSNGLASGMNENEAIFSAIYEIIERHSVTSNDFNNNKKQVNLESIENKEIQNCLEKFKRNNIQVTIEDLTVFDDFPTFSASLLDFYGEGCIGWGCNANSEIALLRALLEANQARTIQISGAREDMNKYEYLLNKREINLDDQKKENIFQINFEKNKKLRYIQNINEIKTLFKKHNIADPLFLILEKSERMCAVRVIIPFLHGYMYPGYESIIRKSFVDDLDNYQKKYKHYPAAI